jgi:hypothetical protein
VAEVVSIVDRFLAAYAGVPVKNGGYEETHGVHTRCRYESWI